MPVLYGPEWLTFAALGIREPYILPKTVVYRPDPGLITCHCRRCKRGGQCDWMRGLLDRRRDAEALDALTVEDRAWLADQLQAAGIQTAPSHPVPPRGPGAASIARRTP